MALDLVRSTKDPRVGDEFVAWGRAVISSTPVALHLEPALQLLSSALDLFLKAYQHPIPELIPRPSLLLTGYIASSVFLLEHAIWSYSTEQEETVVDVEVARRWIVESGLVGIMNDVETIRKDKGQRVELNTLLVKPRL